MELNDKKREDNKVRGKKRREETFDNFPCATLCFAIRLLQAGVTKELKLLVKKGNPDWLADLLSFKIQGRVKKDFDNRADAS